MIQIILSLILLSAFGNEDKAKSYEVFIFLHDECVISRYYTLPLAELHAANEDIADFIGVFPNSHVTDARLNEFKEKFDIPFKLILDPEFELVDQFQAMITPEVFVRESSTGTILYSGRIDNAYARVGRKRTVVSAHELRQVLTSLRAHKKIKITREPAIGCLITRIKN